MEKIFEQLSALKFYCEAGFMAAKTWEMFIKAFGNSSVLRLWYFHGIAGLRWVRSRLKTQSGAEGREQRKQMRTLLRWQLF